MPRAIFLAIALLLAPAAALAESLSADEAKRLAEGGEIALIDIRLATEWAETGLPEGALGVSLQDPMTLRTRPEFAEDLLQALEGDRERPIALICATGVRSAYAAELLQQRGFTEVHHVAEGMLGSEAGPGWLARALPTEPCQVC